jgi:hypothetical protein
MLPSSTAELLINDLVPMLGRRRLVELTVHDVDAWLADRATMLSTDTVHRLHGILRAVLRRAQVMTT